MLDDGWELNSEAHYPTSWSNFGGNMIDLSGNSSLNETNLGSGLRTSSIGSSTVSWLSFRARRAKELGSPPV